MLTPQQVEEARKKYGVKPAPSPEAQNRIAELESAWGATETAPDKTMLGAFTESMGKEFGGGEESIGSKLIKTIKQGGEEYNIGDSTDFSAKKLFAPTKAMFRGLGDVAGAVFAPMGAAVDAVTGGKISQTFQDIGTASQEKGGIMDFITDIPAVQEFATKYPEAGPDFIRAMNLIFLAQANKMEPSISTLPERTAAQIKTVTEFPGQVVSKVDSAFSKLNELETKALNYGKEKIGGISKKVEGAVSQPIEKPVQSSLRETPREQFDIYAKKAQLASESYKNQTPLEYAGERAQGALDTIQRKLNNIGQSKNSVMNQASVGTKQLGNIATKFRQEITNYLKTKTGVEGDTKLFRDVLSEAEKLGSNPRALQVDKFIDFVQDRIYSSTRDLTVPVTPEATAVLRQITGKLNGALKSQLPESYSGLNQKYQTLVEMRNELNMKLGAAGEKGGSLMKRVFSPSDAGTKKLFEAVQKETGIDLVNEATLARYVMETLGDARQMSMLEQLGFPKSPQGVIDWVWNKTIERFNKPEAQLERARSLTPETSIVNPAKIPAVTPATVSKAQNYAKMHISEAQDVVAAKLPTFEANGGIKALLTQTKKNIVDGLQEGGVKNPIANLIDKNIDVSKFSTLEQFSKAVDDLLSDSTSSGVGGLSIKNVVKQLNLQDKLLMQKFIDDVRLKGTARPDFTMAEEQVLFKLNEMLGIDVNASAQSIATQFENIMGQIKK
jgi:hypothetical protein